MSIIAAAPIIGALASAGGALYSGIATSEAANYRSQVAKNNAQIANANATRAIAAGQQQAQNQSLKNAETIGGIKTAQAANGVDVNSGSALDVQVSQRAKGQLDAETTLQKSALEAYSYRTTATSDTAESELQQSTAENAIPGAALTATGGLLSSDKFTGALSGSGGIGTFGGNFGSAPTWIGGT